MKPKQICVVTAGQLSTCPRMVKAADALHDHGYQVTMVSTQGWADWATVTDQNVFAARREKWKWVVVPWSKASAPATRFWSAVRFRSARRLAAWCGGKNSLPLLGAAHVRVSPEIVRAAVRQECDLYYGGGSALAATAIAGKNRGVPFGLDLEDFHSAEVNDSREADEAHRVVEQIEKQVLSKARFLTAGSQAIAEAYGNKYGVAPIAINNTFPLPASPPGIRIPDGILKFYWFSQTVGANRGLEDAVRAIGIAGIKSELHLRGQEQPGYLQSLRVISAKQATGLTIFLHAPGPPDEMINMARGYDIGLALEQPEVLNRDLCLTNKGFTYILAGLAVIFTDTKGQRPLAASLGKAAISYQAGDIESLARDIRKWADQPEELRAAKEAAWFGGRERWHWEHENERGALIRAVNSVWS